jgi:hypothetical protein
MQVLHLPTQTITHAKSATKSEEYNCTKCNGCLILRNGKKRAPHFSHRIRCHLVIQSHINKPKISKCVHCNTECEWTNHEYIWIKEYADKVYYFKQDCELCKYGQIYLNQRGAGCGKTYESIQLMNDPRFQYKTTFIYLTKMHSAKEVIYTEIQQQERKFKYLKMEKNDPSGKQYKISFLKKDALINVLIGTIDSFTYAMADKSVPIDDEDYFRGIVNTIQHGNIVSPELVKYAQQNMHLCRKTLVIIDEAQDTNQDQWKIIHYLTEEIRSTNMQEGSLFIVGDEKQTIYSFQGAEEGFGDDLCG